MKIMKPVYSKCGNICSSCPWGVWVRRNQTPEEWDSYAEDVKKYVGYSPTKNPCHGCQTPTENLAKDVGFHNFLRGCDARKCAIHNDIRNCAYCSRYPCVKIKSLNITISREAAEERIGESIPEDKYLAYVRVFEGMKNLDEIRSNLKSDQIQEVKTVERVSAKIVAFPEVTKKHMKYKSLHDSLTIVVTNELGLIDTDTVAGQEMLKKRRAVLLRLLWIVANYGTTDGDRISVDSIAINTHKKRTSGFPTTESGWKRWMEILSTIGIRGEMRFAALDRSEFTSPMGWLRDRIPGTNDPVWFLLVSLDEELGGVSSLKLLESYAHLLDKEYGNRAYGRFTKADMRFLQDQ